MGKEANRTRRFEWRQKGKKNLERAGKVTADETRKETEQEKMEGSRKERGYNCKVVDDNPSFENIKEVRHDKKDEKEKMCEGEGSAKIGDGEVGEEEQGGGVRHSLEDAMEDLCDEWVEIGTVFMAWWDSAEFDTKIALLESGREVVALSLASSACPAAAAALPALCPELHPAKLARLAEPKVLPLLINARLSEPEVTQAHDAAFVSANTSMLRDVSTSSLLSTKQSIEDQLSIISVNRSHLMTVFFTNILSLSRHLCHLSE
eukprot:CAMPEP_0196582758 /NCGR_PEP_ID=MMETSP1081-20130531/40528_1 /TAXON_ID=36882 /ORGANISM="Pyramimonas amylifera, Strain CCMP720" /LENGTH=261 /DNA_ID=CAMNT_0041903431 /DNA_START=23 /DNA_END=808 /DNA_ORIENTATION=-